MTAYMQRNPIDLNAEPNMADEEDLFRLKKVENMLLQNETLIAIIKMNQQLKTAEALYQNNDLIQKLNANLINVRFVNNITVKIGNGEYL